MERLIASKSAVLIDARFAADYRMGHLPGAISVPVTSSRRLRESLLKGVAKDEPIVLYCQSEGCPFDEILGGLLIANGYSNLRIYGGGWADWSSKTRRP